MKRKNPVVLQHHWLRVILDEAHCIRNQRTLASKVCCNLKADHRWCVSGTIIQNSMDDCFGIMKFLKHEPWCFPQFWKAAITAPSSSKADDALNPDVKSDKLQLVIKRVRRVLGPLMLRRTKDTMTKDGQPILMLPPVETKVVEVDLSESERDFYNAVLARSMEVFDGFIRAGTASKSYIQIFSMLMRLRQVCDHIALTVKRTIDDDEWMMSAEDKRPTDGVTQTGSVSNLTTDTDALGKSFLDSLLKKFCEKESTRNSPKRLTDEPDTPSKRPKDESYQSQVARALAEAIKEKSSHIDEECAICLDRPKIDEAVLTPCAHIFCRLCLVEVLRAGWEKSNEPSMIVSKMGCPDGKCPVCQTKVEAKRIISLSKSGDDSGGTVTSSYLTKEKSVPARVIKQEVRETQEGNPFVAARRILESAVSGTESSKMKAVLHELMAIWMLDPGSKILIFSHFLGFLDVLGNMLRENQIKFFRLDGRLSLHDRMQVLEQFRLSKFENDPTNDPSMNPDSSIQKGTVLLMSMSAGGEGLNITSASSCFIVEPW
jgi:DNA repair protein RAD5